MNIEQKKLKHLADTITKIEAILSKPKAKKTFAVVIETEGFLADLECEFDDGVTTLSSIELLSVYNDELGWLNIDVKEISWGSRTWDKLERMAKEKVEDEKNDKPDDDDFIHGDAS